MMSRMAYLAALPAVALAAGGAGSAATSNASSPAAQCEVRAYETQGQLTLQGAVVAHEPISGSYDFRVQKRGGGGTSNTRQGGDFAADPGEEVRLGSVTVGLSSGASADADLTVTWPGGKTSCSFR